MLRAIALAAGCLVLVAGPAAAYEWGYDCTVKDKGTEIGLHSTFNSDDGGKLTNLTGDLAVKDWKLEEKLTRNELHQSWTTDRNFNIQIGTDRTDWMLVIETACNPKNNKAPCKGSYLVTSKKEKKSKEGRITCDSRR
jgi:hypothetical protein